MNVFKKFGKNNFKVLEVPQKCSDYNFRGDYTFCADCKYTSFTKDTGLRKLNFQWSFKKISKATGAKMKGYLKAASIYMNRFLKATSKSI
jgi:hypothetical protein